ncbi:hypothetical protein F5Y07DRAFT_371535 [Xylaria sp. FL0933]|nr:hypothetical protein F5Y07DRAFT_371535 [Xylaria sp. FL0933]
MLQVRYTVMKNTHIYIASLRRNSPRFSKTLHSVLPKLHASFLSHHVLSRFYQQEYHLLISKTRDWELNEPRVQPLLTNRKGGLNKDMDTCAWPEGQKRLLCLARAMVRKRRMLLFDEIASRSTDRDTESKNCTVMAIMHRLNHVLDYDIVTLTRR